MFRNWISREAGARFPPEKDRYHLYVSYACPWGMLLSGSGVALGERGCLRVELMVDLSYSASDVDYEEAERFGGYHLVHVGTLAHGR